MQNKFARDFLVKTQSLFLATGLVLAGALVAPRHAESADLESVRSNVKEIVDDLAVRCRYDLEKYCANVTPGEGRLAFCLMANADKRSPQCEYAIFDASRAADKIIAKVGHSISACQSDIATLCSGTEVRQGRLVQCLADQKPALSGQCRDVIDVVGAVVFPAHNDPVVDRAATPSAPAAVVAEAPPAATQQTDAGAALVTALQAKVQDIIERGKQGCRSDLEKYCSDVMQGEGRLAFCLIAHADKRSTQCDDALATARVEAETLIENVDQSVQACLPDIAALCSGTAPGRGRIAQCLVDQKPSLTEKCSEVVDVVGKVIFAPRNQPAPEITTGSIESRAVQPAAETPKDKCRTLETSVTDWGKAATSNEARNLLKGRAVRYAAKQGLKDYKPGVGTVSCSTNINIGFIGNYTCQARMTVCVSAVEGSIVSSGNSPNPPQ